MGEIQRYTLALVGDGRNEWTDIVPHDLGGIVKYDDHTTIVAALEKERDAAVAKLVRIRDVIVDENQQLDFAELDAVNDILDEDSAMSAARIEDR